MRVLNPGQFQQVWNFLNFPAKISPRMSVEGEGGEQPGPTSPSSPLTGDTSNLICQHNHEFLQSHIFTGFDKCKMLRSQSWDSHIDERYFLASDQSPEENIRFDNCCRVETFRTEKLTSISLPNFTPSGWVHNWVTRAPLLYFIISWVALSFKVVS